MSLIDKYPEAFEKHEYTVNEIVSRTQISRRVFDRYKKKFPDFYNPLSRKVDRGKVLYRPEILMACFEISEKLKKNLSHKDIENYFVEELKTSMKKPENLEGDSSESEGKTEKVEVPKPQGSGPEMAKLKGDLFEAQHQISLLKQEVSLVRDQVKVKDEQLFLLKDVYETQKRLLEAPKEHKKKFNVIEFTALVLSFVCVGMTIYFYLTNPFSNVTF